ncbi:D-arabinono-1,4-lactone oxidase [Zafaria sp. Z1313]|uniref:D-arabinono-1,4-lactone oxidase n=1 Tax=Zafaria sp. Z1313 TaxID=3423202 RepID=UPI003D302938
MSTEHDAGSPAPVPRTTGAPGCSVPDAATSGFPARGPGARGPGTWGPKAWGPAARGGPLPAGARPAPGRLGRADTGGGVWAWSNWSGSERSRPSGVVVPSTDAEVAALLRRASEDGTRVKAVGGAHSFSPIAATDGLLLGLDALQGLVAVDAGRGEAVFRAGTRLHRVAGLLAPHGLALPTMGDIDRQSIAGALATGTHGTGLGFTGYSGIVAALRIALPDGRIVDCSERTEPELFQAARVGLGAVGVVLEATLRCVPAFRLAAVEAPEPLAQMEESFLERSRTTDHLEFYWFPQSRTVLSKANTRLPGDAPLRPVGRIRGFVDDELLGNAALGLMCGLGRAVPSLVGPLNRLATRAAAERGYVDASHRVFVSPRRVRFREMEYALPLEAFGEAFAELRRAVEGYREPISFPVEVRTAAADDTWLGTASGRESVYFAVHRYAREPHAEFLEHVEQVFTAHGGRPHWGKIHTRDAGYLRGLYPRFDDFTRVRDAVDPAGTLLNPYLERVLGIRAP